MVLQPWIPLVGLAKQILKRNLFLNITRIYVVLFQPEKTGDILVSGNAHPKERDFIFTVYFIFRKGLFRVKFYLSGTMIQDPVKCG